MVNKSRCAGTDKKEETSTRPERRLVRVVSSTHEARVFFFFQHVKWIRVWRVAVWSSPIAVGSSASKASTKRPGRLGVNTTHGRQIHRPRSDSIVQDELTNWLQSSPMKTKETSETMSCLQRVLSPSQKRETILTDNSQEFVGALPDLQWSHDTSTPHRSETKWVERAVRRVRQGTAIAQVQSGLPEEWWDCAMECCCYLSNVHDKMADGTAFRETMWWAIWRSIPSLLPRRTS